MPALQLRPLSVPRARLGVSRPQVPLQRRPWHTPLRAQSGPRAADAERNADVGDRQRLERLLPLASSDRPAAVERQAADHLGAPGRSLPPVSSGEAAAQQLFLQQAAVQAAALDAAAGGDPAVAGEHRHHHDEGPLTLAITAVLAKLGIEISPRARGLICLNVLVLLFATNWVVIKDSESAMDPYLFSFLRFTVAAAAFTPFLKAASADKRVVSAGVELGIWTAAGYLLQSQGLLTTDASRASFLSTFTVIIVPILAGLSGRGVQPLTWFSALAALIGMSMLEGGGGSPPCIGDVWSFLSALAFGVQVFRTEHWARTLGAKRALPLMSVVLAVTMACALGAAVLAHPQTALDLMEHPWLAQQAFEQGHFPWQAALYTGLLTTDVCLLLEMIALKDVSSVEAAIVYALEPVLGALFAYLLLGERWGPLGWMGAGLIILSSVVVQLCGSDPGEPVVASEGESEAEAP